MTQIISSQEREVQEHFEHTKKNLDICIEYISCHLQHIPNLTQAYRQQNFALANKLFIQIIEDLDKFIIQLKKIFQNHRDLFEGDSLFCTQFHHLELELIDILQGLLLAKTQKDIVLLSDLLEYELTPNLHKWSIDIIEAIEKLCVAKIQG